MVWEAAALLTAAVPLLVSWIGARRAWRRTEARLTSLESNANNKLAELSPPANLVERLENLERGSKLISLEWNEVFDRLQRTMGRIDRIKQVNDGLHKHARGGEPSASPPPLTPEQQLARATDERLRLGAIRG